MTTQADTLPSKPTDRRKIRWSRVALYVTLVLAAAAYLLPVYLLIITGMKSFQEVSLARHVGLAVRHALRQLHQGVVWQPGPRHSRAERQFHQ